jgi:hypothetical protein
MNQKGLLNQFLKACIFFLYKFSLYGTGRPALELQILLPLPPECWDCRCVPPHPGKHVLLYVVTLVYTLNNPCNHKSISLFRRNIHSFIHSLRDRVSLCSPDCLQTPEFKWFSCLSLPRTCPASR